jgi:hypothetical protein
MSLLLARVGVASGTSGSVLVVEALDSVLAEGSPRIVATLVKTTANDVIAAVGTPLVDGTISLTENVDLRFIFGSSGLGITGEVLTTANNDTSNITGSMVLLGTMNSLENQDNSSSGGSSTVSGSLSRTVNNDIMAASSASAGLGSFWGKLTVVVKNSL